MRVIVTAIGSMSAECVVSSLVSRGIEVVGTDIYQREFHPISTQCHAFVQVPAVYSNPKFYCQALLQIAVEQGCIAIVPLTDPEVDALTDNREMIESNGVALWLAASRAIRYARSKLRWRDALSHAKTFSVIPTYATYADLCREYKGEFVAKKEKGRSSEGIVFANTAEKGRLFSSEYVFQPFIDGSIVTVDFVTHPKSGRIVCLPRRECLRTKNGAGTAVEILDPAAFLGSITELVKELQLTGVMNAEFILSEKTLYLMDINPRFSAGVSFSALAGYDFVGANVDCYVSEDVAMLTKIKVGSIFVKRFSEFEV